MSQPPAPRVPPVSPDHRRIAVAQFERANQVVASGNYDYGVRLLMSCCKLDPANLLYREALRRTEKAKYGNNLQGRRLAWLWTWSARARMKAAAKGRDHLGVLEHGERVLANNPWDTGSQLDMASAAEALGLMD